jgi:hypothetical protein
VVLIYEGGNKMRKNSGQMLLLTGITMILIFISASFISTQIANVEVESSLEKSHSLIQEFEMVKTNFIDALNNEYNLGNAERYDNIVQRFKSIESKHNVNFDAEFVVDSNIVRLTLSNSDTTITEEFDYKSVT